MRMRGEVFFVSNFIAAHWAEILLGLVSAGALGVCKYLISQIKNYKALLNEKQTEQVEETIDQKVEPILHEIEELRAYMRKTREIEQCHVDLIVASYRFRLIQLCKIYIKQGFMTQDQYDQLMELYKVYTGFGGNGQAKEYFDRAISLEIRTQ